MKKILTVLLALGLLLSVTGCARESAPQAVPQGTPAEIIEQIYSNHKTFELSVLTRDIDLSDANDVLYNTGLESGDKLSAASVSEAMLGQAYSLLIARVKDGADAPQVARDIYDKVDTAKWICVDADTKTAAYCGDVVMFFMVNSQFANSVSVDTMMEAFKAVCGGNVTVIG